MVSHYLYLIASENSGPIKIGISKNVKQRILMLQTGFPYKLRVFKKWSLPIEVAYVLEKVSHHSLEEHRLNGEWFSCSPELAVETISEVMIKSRKGKDLEAYEDAIIAKVRSKAAIVSAAKKKLFSKRAIRKIRHRWPLPSKEWPTKVLLKEAGVSLNTVKSLLGKRPIAQYNYQAKMKRAANKVRK